MKKLLIPALLTCAVILTAGAAKKDAGDTELMNINGKAVTLSEFEYLYNKNNKQQVEPQSVADYVDMFINYKLKVADAEAAGVDTTAAFKKEYEGYCLELAKPYLRDSMVEKRLMEEAFSRMPRMVEAAHIMFPLNPKGKALADSVHQALLDGADFAEMARQHSSDRQAVRNGGNQGFILACDYPYPFENAVFNTPIGQISEVFEDAPYGYHIVKTLSEKQNPGEIKASHILKLTQGLDKQQAAAKKASIDSIYNVLMAGADFAEVATRESEDPGSAKRGGDLGYFGPGKMVPDFETAAYKLDVNEISKPVKTPFGYHIIKVTGHKGVQSLKENTDLVKAAMARDIRSKMPEDAKIAELQKKYGIIAIESAIPAIDQAIEATEGDPFDVIKENTTVVAQMGAQPVTVADIAKELGGYRKGIPFQKAVDLYLSRKTKEQAMDILAKTDADYRNLINEYRDGILLFDVSNKNVWEKSTNDKEGLEAYFNAHRDAYTWDTPHYKGAVIFANSDSVAALARDYLKNNTIESDSLVSKLKERFNRDVKLERVVAAKGENKIVDNVAFDGEKPAAPGSWVAWFGYDGRVINQPEEASDLRGVVSNDYQQELEKQWVEQLRAKYPWSVNDKEIKKLIKAEKKQSKKK